MNEERLPQKLWDFLQLEEKYKDFLEFLDAGSNNWNEREGN